MLLPAYGNFIARLQDFLGNHAYEYIEYGIFDIQDQLNNLFLVRMQMNESDAERETCPCAYTIVCLYTKSQMCFLQDLFSCLRFAWLKSKNIIIMVTVHVFSLLPVQMGYSSKSVSITYMTVILRKGLPKGFSPRKGQHIIKSTVIIQVAYLIRDINPVTKMLHIENQA